MDGRTVFDGSARARAALSGGRGVEAGDGSPIRGAHQIRDTLIQRWRARGTLQPGRIAGGKRPTLAAPAEQVRALLAAVPDLTIAELQSRLAAAGITTSRSAPGRLLLADAEAFVVRKAMLG